MKVEVQKFGFFAVLTTLMALCLTQVLEVRAQVPTDSSLVPKYETAQRLDSEAVELNKQNTVEARRKAIDKHSEAAANYLEVGSKKEAARSLGQVGILLGALNEVPKSLEYLQRALKLFREIADPVGEAATLNYIGTAELLLGDGQNAINSFELALSRYRAFGDRSGEGESLVNIGAARGQSGEKQKALESFVLALPIFRAVGDRRGELIVLGNIGQVYYDLGEKKKALDHFTQLADLQRTDGDRAGEADTLLRASDIYRELRETSKSLEKSELALQIFKGIGNQAGEAYALSNIGAAHRDLGDGRKASEYFEKALTLFRAARNKPGQALALNNLGQDLRSAGVVKKALDHHTQALNLCREASHRLCEADTLIHIASVYGDLRDFGKALEHYSRAVEIHRELGTLALAAGVVIDAGVLLDRLGERQKALESFEQALQWYRRVGDSMNEAVVLNNIGAVLNAQGAREKALEHHEIALKIATAKGDRKIEAGSLSNIGGVYLDLGQNRKALEYFAKALPILKATGDRRSEAVTLNNLMLAWKMLGTPAVASAYGKRAVNVYQGLRAEIRDFEKQTQRSYLESIQHTYRSLADILIAQGRIAEAEQVLGMLKEEEYFSFVRRDDSAAKYLKDQKIALSPEEQKAFEEYEKLAGDITKTAAAYEELRKKKLALPLGESLPAAAGAEYDRLKAAADAAVTVFSKFLDDLKVRFGGSDKRVAALESDSIGLLKEVNQPRTVMISTIVGEDRLNLIVTTSSVQKAHTVEIKADELNKLILEFRNALTNPRIDPRPAGKALYDKLFPAELKKDLANVNADTIVWSLDGALRYAPMAALWDGEKYLAERYQNAVLTLASRSKLSSAGTDSANWKAFGVGVSKEVPGEFSALPAVPRELCSVIADAKKKALCDTFGRKGVFDGLMLADEEFTLDSFENSLGKTPVVHIASHFALNPGNETESFLLLGGGADRKFSLDRLRKTRLDGVELLTLSACNTAMTSGNRSNGVEVEGFGAMALNNGAKSVLATLWPVADEGTQLLMSEFYRLKKETPSMSKSAALQAAQRAMIDGKVRSSGADSGCRAKKFGAGDAAAFKCDPNAPFTHPYFWAPFVLIGNWR